MKHPRALVAAVLVVGVLLALAACRRRGGCPRDTFVSEQAKEVYAETKPLFDRTQGRATYSEYRMRVPGADPVQYTDMRNMWKSGSFTPQGVQDAL